MGHPNDPFGRIDVLSSSRRVVGLLAWGCPGGQHRPTLLFETSLPTRYYLPRDDISWDLLAPEANSVCAYKGVARYWTARLTGGDLQDVAWTYEEPLQDALKVRGMVVFFTERLDRVLTAYRSSDRVTPWSRT